jgi:A/G-specific adenine glycosylase
MIEPASLGRRLRRHSVPLLLVRRSDRGLLGGLWELPNFPERGNELAERLASLDVEILLDLNREIRHRYSHFEIRLQPVVVLCGKPQTLTDWAEQRWVAPTEVAAYPRPMVHIRAMRLLGLSNH